MKVINNPFHIIPFSAAQKISKEDKNPISQLGERETLLKATAVAGLGFGARALFVLWENGFEFEYLWHWGRKIVDKNKQGAKNKELLYIGAFGALALGFIATVAALYTLFKTPDIMYNGKINAFVKNKDMDLYRKSNKVEVELYDQMNDKAKDATDEEKKVLAQQYLKLKAAKNPTPDFIKQK